MDNWQVAQNYLVAAAIGGAVGGYYYYTANQRKPNRTGSLNVITSRRSETDLRGRNARQTRDTSTPSSRQTSTSTSTAARQRKARPDAAQPKLEAIASTENVADEKPAKEADMSAAQFAKQMQQARQGSNLSTSKNKETRVKTVKPRASNSTFATPFEETESTPAENNSSSYSSGDVSDMLEPVAPPPSTLRITSPAEPQKTKTPRQPKQEVVETKKQRQNRKKAEERKALREEEEKERRALEEKQRRTARQARGEPAKNGIHVSRTPLNNAWEQRNANNAAAVQASDAVSSGAHGVMLDTFDAESTSSSNGGPGASTAATSTTSGEQSRWDASAEEEQIAAAIKESGDEAGWTTVSGPVKGGKKKHGGITEASSGAITPVKDHSKQTTSNGHIRTGAYAALDTSASD